MSDIIIIGAGVIGCACAFELASAGATVTVLEARQVGQGATQASAGVLAPFIEGHDSGPLCDLGQRSLALYDSFVQRVTAAADRSVQYSRSGTLEIALDPDHAARLRAQSSLLTHDRGTDQPSPRLRRSAKALGTAEVPRYGAHGIGAQWLDERQLKEAEPLVAAGAVGGLLIESHGFVGVQELTDALSVAAMRAGARFATERVVSIARLSRDRLQVITERGTFEANQVIVAAGSWHDQIAIDGVSAPAGIKPMRGQLLHLGSPATPPLRRVLWGTDCYLVPWRDGRVLVGATVEDVGFDERATAAGVRSLLEAGCALVPHLWQASFKEVRVGLRPASPDGLPLIGRSTAMPGLIYATGHYRNGVLLAPLTAALISNLVIRDAIDPALEMVRPSRLGNL